VRENDTTEQQFISQDGPSIVVRTLQDTHACERFVAKAAFFLNSIAVKYAGKLFVGFYL
jgi:hypothetical protein